MATKPIPAISLSGNPSRRLPAVTPRRTDIPAPKISAPADAANTVKAGPFSRGEQDGGELGLVAQLGDEDGHEHGDQFAH
jgi:hypothetical protein